MSGGNLPTPQPMSPAGDVWSLGMTLVETLTQNLPVARTAEQQDPLFPQDVAGAFSRNCAPMLASSAPKPMDSWPDRGPIGGPRSKSPRSGSRQPKSGLRYREPQPIARPSRPTAKRRSYAVPIAIGSALVLAAILAGPRLLRRHSNAPQAPAATVEQPPVASAPRQAAPPPQEHSANAYNPAVAEEERSSKPPVPVPALIHPETAHSEERNAAARLPVVAPVHGEVTQQVMPEVLQSARNSIRGTVKVTVRVNVDRSGNVEDAVLESRGPSKYFARAALEAARKWKFKAPMAGGRGVLSTWTLRFQFTRAETTVVPVQELP